MPEIWTPPRRSGPDPGRYLYRRYADKIEWIAVCGKCECNIGGTLKIDQDQSRWPDHMIERAMEVKLKELHKICDASILIPDDLSTAQAYADWKKQGGQAAEDDRTNFYKNKIILAKA